MSANTYLNTIITCMLMAWSSMLMAQAGRIAYYPFDDGTAEDHSGMSHGILSDNPPTIGCGVIGNALYFNGQDNYVDLLGIVSDGDYFKELGDFTISFYFRTDSPFGTHDILSKREDCGIDNTFAVRYTPASSTLSVELNEDVERRAVFTERLDPNRCWIHVAITKSRGRQVLYVNGELLSIAMVSGDMDMTTPAQFKIADSPCLGSTDRRFSGYLDELSFFNRALRSEEIAEMYEAIDVITTRDTTIYEGSMISLDGGNTCAADVMWLESVDDPMQLMTTVSPNANTTYHLTYLYGTCTALDSVQVTVIDPSQVDCGNIPMASAFTPNGDGRNDTYFISNPFSVQRLIRFEIFDRLGNRVFASTDVRGAWDGSYLGSPVNPGIFLYKIRYDCGGSEFSRTGSVMVLR